MTRPFCNFLLSFGDYLAAIALVMVLVIGVFG